MTVERTEVRIDVTGTAQAKAAADSLQREMTDLEGKAHNAERAVSSANRSGGRLNQWFDSLRDRGIVKRGGLELGPMELNRQGFGLNGGFFRGGQLGQGMAMGLLITGLGRLAAAGAGSVADFRYDLARGGWDGARAGIKAKLRESADAALAETVSGVGNIVGNVWRMFSPGVSAETSAAAWNEYWQAGAVGLGLRDETDLEKQIADQRARMRALRAQLVEQERADKRAEEDRRARREEALAASDAEIERRSLGLKALRPSIGLSRRQAVAYKLFEQVGQFAVAALQKQRSRQLLVNEGA